jgi:ribosomal protein L37E
MSVIRCPMCGQRILGSDTVCKFCGYPMPNVTNNNQEYEAKRKLMLNRGLKNNLISGIVIAVIWDILTWYVPSGWPILTVNIFFLLISIWIFWWPLLSFLKTALPTWMAWLVSLLGWLLLFVGLRSLVDFIFRK